MKIRFVSTAAVSALLLAAPVFASFSGGSKNDPPPSSSSAPGEKNDEKNPRAEAEKWYGDAYDEIAKAKKEIAAGKTKNVDKRFQKALERGQRAVEMDSTYHEAWNLVGYAARKLKRYDQALASYDKCLAIAPDYAPAREYLGEAYLELDQPEKARQQLAWLEKLNATEDVATLKTALDAWSKAHPEAAAAAAPAEPAATPADSSGSK